MLETDELKQVMQTLCFDITCVMAAGCGPVIPISTFVWASVSHRPVYMLGHYGDSVRDGFRILFILGVGMH